MSTTYPSNNRIAVFGASHAATHFNMAANSTTGEGAKPSGSILGPVNWANFLSGGRAVLENTDCFGYNGDWTAPMTWNGQNYPGMLSRVDALIASGAGHAVLVAPTVNDRNAWTAAQSIENMTTIIDKIIAADMMLTILMDYPHGAAAFPNLRLQNTAAAPQVDYWNQVNRWLFSLHGKRGIRVVDTPAILADFTSGAGQAAAGVTLEGLHLSTLGSYMVGRVLAREWRRIYPAVGTLPFGSSERQAQAGANPLGILSSQPYFGGTGGTLGAGATGQLANDWTTALGDGVAGAYSKVTTTAFAGRTYAEDGDGPLSKDWQQITLSGTGTGSNEIAIIRQNVSCSIGDVLRACAEIEVDAGATGIAGVVVYVFHNGSGQQIRQLAIPAVASQLSWPAQALTGIMRTPRWTADSGQMILQLAIRPITGAAINATIRVRGMAVGKGL